MRDDELTEPIPTDPVPTQRVVASGPALPAVEPPGSEPAPAAEGATAAPPAIVAAPARSDGGGRQLIAAALLSAVLASGGTVAVLNATGNLGARIGTPAAAGNPAASHQAVTIDESSAVIDAAAKVSPAVVRITASSSGTDQLGSIPETGVGSGVIFDSAGWILTNRHVVRSSNGDVAGELSIDLKDGREFPGRVYGVDTLTDLAIVKIDATGLPAASLGSSLDLKVGQLAIAIGSPLATYTNSVTSGIVSATGRSIVVETGVRLNDLIQTDAAINPGNSGGPLLDAAGNVIGINTAVAQGSNGIGFAIPIDIAKPIMRQALAGAELARPYIGIRYELIDVQLKEEKDLAVDHGALIGPGQDASGGQLPAVTPDSPAAKAGLKAGDVITEIEGQAIDNEHPLDMVLSGYAPGQTIHLTVLRGSETLTLSVTLGTRPAGL